MAGVVEAAANAALNTRKVRAHAVQRQHRASPFRRRAATRTFVQDHAPDPRAPVPRSTRIAPDHTASPPSAGRARWHGSPLADGRSVPFSARFSLCLRSKRSQVRILSGAFLTRSRQGCPFGPGRREIPRSGAGFGVFEARPHCAPKPDPGAASHAVSHAAGRDSPTPARSTVAVRRGLVPRRHAPGRLRRPLPTKANPGEADADREWLAEDSFTAALTEIAHVTVGIAQDRAQLIMWHGRGARAG
jgi:hypothetical protein